MHKVHVHNSIKVKKYNIKIVVNIYVPKMLKETHYHQILIYCYHKKFNTFEGLDIIHRTGKMDLGQ